MTHILHRNLRAELPVAVSGHGVFIRDSDGKDYVDATGGAAVSCLGHGNPEVLAAMRQQMEALEYAHTTFFTTEAAESLADDLIAHAPDGLSHVYFVGSGSEAMETALKLARQYFLERGEPQRTRFIARRQSYHGSTLGALSIGGHTMRREPFEPMLFDTSHIEPCYAYRHRRTDESDGDYGATGGRRSGRSAIGTGSGHGHRVCRRNDRRCDRRCRAPVGRVFSRDTADLRSLRCPAHSGRGHVRHGANRHAACL